MIVMSYIALETRNVMDATVVNTIRTVELLGQEQYQIYRQAVIIDHTQSIHDPIKKNSLPYLDLHKNI